MRFLLDMGVDVRVATWLREQGHEVLHLRDEGLQPLPNGEIFTSASLRESSGRRYSSKELGVIPELALVLKRSLFSRKLDSPR